MEEIVTMRARKCLVATFSCGWISGKQHDISYCLIDRISAHMVKFDQHQLFMMSVFSPL